MRLLHGTEALAQQLAFLNRCALCNSLQMQLERHFPLACPFRDNKTLAIGNRPLRHFWYLYRAKLGRGFGSHIFEK
jgi:hypothetical protein